jgi:hypothetical protein
MKKQCMTCELLGACDLATEEMVKNYRGCGSWKKAVKEVINARRKARALAGAQAIQEMLRTPPEKLID